MGWTQGGECHGELSPMGGAQVGEVHEELSPMGWTHVDEFHGELPPMGGTPWCSRGMTPLPQQWEKPQVMK